MSETRRDSQDPYASPPREAASSRGSAIKAIIAAVVGILCVIYLINPTAGVLEFIPDNFPVIGNLDEATATALLLSSLAYFGWDLRSLFGRRNSGVSQDRGTIDHQGPSRGE